jgi:hypothetical protein
MVRRSLAETISSDIARRDFTGTGQTQNIATPAPQDADEDFTHPVAEPKRKKKIALMRIRVDSGDFKKFQSICYSSGSNASCVLRQYIKKVIKAGEV